MMSFTTPEVLNLVAALFCLSLGVLVLMRNPRKTTHQTFAAVSFNFMLWAVGVFAILHANTDGSARFWVSLTEMVACFIPATFYHFVGHFPRGGFDGNKKFLFFLYAIALILAPLTWTTLYVEHVRVLADGPPEARHGPLYLLFPPVAMIGAGAIVVNATRKFRQATGIQRRQLQYILLGIYSTAALVGLTTLFDNTSLQAYGPVSIVPLMSFFAYAIIRYHLLDTRVLLARTIVLATLLILMIVLLSAAVSLVQWYSGGDLDPSEVTPIVVSVLAIAVVLQVVGVRLSALVDRTVLKRRYDINRVFTRITQSAAEVLELEQLLKTVADDIRETVGVDSIRVLLTEEADPGRLKIYYSTIDGEIGQYREGHANLLEYLNEHSEPIALERILETKPEETMSRVAHHLAELDAHFCLPLKTSGRLVGIMTMGQKDSHDIYSLDEFIAFRALAGPLATGIVNARLYNELQGVHLHLSRVFRQMREGVIAVDAQGRVTTVNQAAIQMIGDVKEGESLESLTPEVADLLQRTLQTGRPVRDFETRVRPPNGEEAPVVMSSSCIHVPGNGEMAGALALIYDLSQVKRLEQNVLRADRLSSIGTLAAGMAHEIKNPLVSIKTFTQLLLSRYKDPDFRNTFKEIVPHEVDRIDTIVSRMLDFARPRPVMFESQSLRGIIDQVLALVENQLRKGSIKVDLSFPEEEVTIYGDEQQLHQVFLNIILNAIHSMNESEGSALHIGAVRDHLYLRRPGSSAMADTECARIDITDTGCGIAPESMQNLFTPFYTTKLDGCGLGLAVVHGIVSEHGGEIDVTSTLASGTTFSVVLPLAQPVTAKEGVGFQAGAPGP